MSATFVAVCLAVGAGTYLFRYLPSRLRPSARPGGAMRGALGAFLGGVGVAAVAALLAASLEPLFAGGVRAVAATLCGLAATALVYWWRKDVAVSTLAGAVAYGVAHWLTLLG